MEFLTINWLLFIPLAIGVIVLLAAIVPHLAIRRIGRELFDYGAGILIIFAYVSAPIVLIFGAAFLVPFNSHYWSIYQATGTVAQTTNSFIDGTGDLTMGSAIVEVDGVDELLVVKDQRLTGRAGEVVTVNCSVAWVPYGADRYNCWLG